MRTHILKTWPEHFESILQGVKKVEVRKNDRCYAVNDILHLKEYEPNWTTYSGRECNVMVTHMLRGGEFGVDKNYCVLSIKLIV